VQDAGEPLRHGLRKKAKVPERGACLRGEPTGQAIVQGRQVPRPPGLPLPLLPRDVRRGEAVLHAHPAEQQLPDILRAHPPGRWDLPARPAQWSAPLEGAPKAGQDVRPAAQGASSARTPVGAQHAARPAALQRAEATAPGCGCVRRIRDSRRGAGTSRSLKALGSPGSPGIF